MTTGELGATDCTVRAARPEDADAILRLWRGADAELSVGEDPATVRALVKHQDGVVLLAEYGDRTVIGSLFACWDGWRGNMYRLAVAPVHRRHGIALRLVSEGERRLRERGARRIAAIVVSESTPAVALWEAAGYQPDIRVTRFVKNVASADNV